MKKKEFVKIFQEIRTKMKLDDFIYHLSYSDNPGYTAWVKNIDYTRFEACIDFNKTLLKESEEQIRLVIVHELCHIYTISSLRDFKDDVTVKQFIGNLLYDEVLCRMNIVNEQMTVRLERLITDLLSKD